MNIRHQDVKSRIPAEIDLARSEGGRCCASGGGIGVGVEAVVAALVNGAQGVAGRGGELQIIVAGQKFSKEVAPVGVGDRAAREGAAGGVDGDGYIGQARLTGVLEAVAVEIVPDLVADIPGRLVVDKAAAIRREGIAAVGALDLGTVLGHPGGCCGSRIDREGDGDGLVGIEGIVEIPKEGQPGGNCATLGRLDLLGGIAIGKGDHSRAGDIVPARRHEIAHLDAADQIAVGGHGEGELGRMTHDDGVDVDPLFDTQNLVDELLGQGDQGIAQIEGRAAGDGRVAADLAIIHGEGVRTPDARPGHVPVVGIDDAHHLRPRGGIGVVHSAVLVIIDKDGR